MYFHRLIERLTSFVERLEMQFFHRNDGPLTPLERKLLDSLVSNVSPDVKSLIEKQIAQFNLIQRHSEQKEVCLYCFKHGKISFPDNLRFPQTQSNSIKLASILFRKTDKRSTLRADFWIVGGHLFSITFNRSPIDLLPEMIEITNVKILSDPLVPSIVRKSAPLAPAALRGWLHCWNQTWRLSELKEPFSLEESETLIHQLDIHLPPDYLELVAQTEGLKVNGCQIYGLSEIYQISLIHHNYYVLATIPELNGTLAVKEDCSDPKIFFISHEDESEIDYGTSFRLAIERCFQSESDVKQDP